MEYSTIDKNTDPKENVPLQKISYQDYLSSLKGSLDKYPNLFRKSGSVCLLTLDIKGRPSVLMTKRSNTISHAGKYVFPGGGIKQGLDRSTLDAAKRELVEETKISSNTISIMDEEKQGESVPKTYLTSVLGTDKKTGDSNTRYWIMDIFTARIPFQTLSKASFKHTEVDKYDLLPLTPLFVELGLVKSNEIDISEEPLVTVGTKQEINKMPEGTEVIVDIPLVTITEPNGNSWTIEKATAYHIINLCKQFSRHEYLIQGIEKSMDTELKKTVIKNGTKVLEEMPVIGGLIALGRIIKSLIKKFQK
ncbi:MAG: NUDIX domain-containing protein [Candidatus Brocadiae bacterium]|nr:NUDIX domain-containing protein [Candidatus Brocadiia bacterium]